MRPIERLQQKGGPTNVTITFAGTEWLVGSKKTGSKYIAVSDPDLGAALEKFCDKWFGVKEDKYADLIG